MKKTIIAGLITAGLLGFSPFTAQEAEAKTANSAFQEALKTENARVVDVYRGYRRHGRYNRYGKRGYRYYRGNRYYSRPYYRYYYPRRYYYSYPYYGGYNRYPYYGGRSGVYFRFGF